MIKSHLLYQLSYRTIFQVGCDQPGCKCKTERSKLCASFFGSRQAKEKPRLPPGPFSDPAGARTQDPYIKSVMLYQLSYRIGRHRGQPPGRPDFEAAKVTAPAASASTGAIFTSLRRTRWTDLGFIPLAAFATVVFRHAPWAVPEGTLASFPDDGQPLEGFAAVEQVAVGGQCAVVCGTKVLAYLEHLRVEVADPGKHGFLVAL